MILPTLADGTAEVCLDEDDEVSDIIDGKRQLVDAMTTKSFCDELRSNDPSLKRARETAEYLFIASCMAAGAIKGGVAGGVGVGAMYVALAAGVGAELTNACNAKWGTTWQ